MPGKETYKREKPLKSPGILAFAVLIFVIALLENWIWGHNGIMLPLVISCIAFVYLIFVWKEVEEIIIDYANRNLIIKYITILNKNNTASIPFNELSFDYRIKKTFWTLFIYSNGAKEFEIKEDNKGFTQITLDKINHSFKSGNIKIYQL